MEIRNGPGLDAETHGNSFSSKAFLNLNLKRNSKEERVIKRAKKQYKRNRVLVGRQTAHNTTQPSCLQLLDPKGQIPMHNLPAIHTFEGCVLLGLGMGGMTTMLHHATSNCISR